MVGDDLVVRVLDGRGDEDVERGSDEDGGGKAEEEQEDEVVAHEPDSNSNHHVWLRHINS